MTAAHLSRRTKTVLGVLLIEAMPSLLWLSLGAGSREIAYAGSFTATGTQTSNLDFAGMAVPVGTGTAGACALGLFLTGTVGERHREYRAKESGRNRMRVHNETAVQLEQTQPMVRREDRIKRALKEDRFVLFYQPILRLADGTEARAARHDRMEEGGRATRGALRGALRMRDEDGGWIAPTRSLIPRSRSGSSRMIDRRAVRLACAAGRDPYRRRISRVASSTTSPCAAGSRIRPARPGRSDAPDVQDHRDACARQHRRAERFIRELAELGCRFAHDDFGAGSTSLRYLKNIPVNVIKIDGDFVQRLDQNRDQALVRAVTDMTHAKSVAVTAEFVENSETPTLLREIGVDHAHSYYYVGRPELMHQAQSMGRPRIPATASLRCSFPRSRRGSTSSRPCDSPRSPGFVRPCTSKKTPRLAGALSYSETSCRLSAGR